MATAIQWRRGTTSQHSSFTGLAGEITVDTDLNTVIVHDGSTAGGHRIAKYTEVTSAAVGDISSIVAGAGLTGGATSGDATINVVGGTGITANANDVAIDATVATLTGSQTLTNKTLTSPVFNTGVSGSAVLDSDTMSGASATTLSSSESIKAYVDTQILTEDNTDEIVEGSTNLYFTVARADARITAALIDEDSFATNSAGRLPSQQSVKAYVDAVVTDDIDEDGSPVNLWYTDARARASVGVTDAGGDGSLAYNSGTGVITYTGPSAAETRAHLSAGTGITITSGAIATTITQYTEALVRGDISVTDAGGDGSAAYNSTTGVITYTGPSASEVRAHSSGGDGIDYTSGAIAVDATVVRTTGAQTVGGAKTFSDDLILSGNLTVNGTQTIVNTETLTVDDNIIILNDNEAGTPSADAGIEIERGTSTNTYIHWKEAGDIWVFNDGTSTYTMPRTTTDLTEGSNLYYTQARADARADARFAVKLAASDTDDLSEGSSNLYYTNARADARITAADTNDLSEGSSNLYFTDARADARITAADTGDLSEGSNLYHTTERVQDIVGAMTTANTESGIAVTYDDADGTLDFTVASQTANDFTNTLKSKLDAIEASATADQTAAEIRTLVGSATDSNVYTDALNTKLAAIEASADVTDATNVNAAGALMLSDTTTAGLGIVIDEDNMASDLATKVPTQQSVKAYVDAQILTEDNTDEIVEGSTNLYHTTARARSSISVSGDLAYNSSTGVISFTNDAGDIEGVTAGTGLTGGGTSGAVTLNVNTGAVSNGASTIPTGDQVYDFVIGLGYTTETGDITGVTAGTGLTGGGTSGTVTLNVSGLTVSELDAGSLQLSSESFADNNTSLMTSAAIADKIEAYGYSTTTGDITAVTAGAGLTGGATSGSADVAVGAGTGITVNANDVAVNIGAFSTSDLSEGSNLYYTSARADARVSAIATKAFVDALNVDADTLDSISSASFLRSDANDSHSGTITPSSNNALNLGSSSLKYANVYATTFQGTATSAQYADLAEKYESDAELEAGTVVMFGGDKEVTECDTENCHAVAGVISTDPAYMMNADGEGQYVALTGRVPCKVTDSVSAGDLLVSAGNGMAKTNNNARAGTIIGKAVGSSEGGETVIEVLVNLM
jgi:hypothetical protein